MALRPFTENDLQTAPWLHQALLGPDGDTVAISRHGKLVGLLQFRVGVPEEGWLAFRFVAVEPRLRGLGLDSEAVRLVEEDALKQGLAHRFWAGVHQGDGLALYFWLRLGYRPAHPDKNPWLGERRGDTICMVRVPENPGHRAQNRGPM